MSDREHNVHGHQESAYKWKNNKREKDKIQMNPFVFPMVQMIENRSNSNYGHSMHLQITKRLSAS